MGYTKPHNYLLDFIQLEIMKKLFHFLAGGIFFLGLAATIGLFKYTWLIENLEKLYLIFFCVFLVVSIILITLYFFIPFKIKQYKNAFLGELNQNISSLRNSDIPISERSTQVLSRVSEKVIDLLIETRTRKIIIGSFLFLFASIIGSVGSILLYKQNILIKTQNETLLKQYTGFMKQITDQEHRWMLEDEKSFNIEKISLERYLIDLHRGLYPFSFDMAVLEEEFYPKLAHNEKIAVQIFDLWELTAGLVDVDKIDNPEDLEEAKLTIAKYEFFYKPVNERIQVMRNYPKDQQKEILESMKGLINDWLKNIKEN